MEVLIELDMEFDWQNFIWVKGVVVTEPLQNFTGLPAGPLHQRVDTSRSVERLLLTRWLM